MTPPTPQTNVRLPPALRAQLEEAAASAGRSLNTEIVSRLESTFEISTPARLMDARIREVNELSDAASRLGEEIKELEKEGSEPLSPRAAMLVYKRRELVNIKDAMRRAYADVEYYAQALRGSVQEP